MTYGPAAAALANPAGMVQRAGIRGHPGRDFSAPQEAVAEAKYEGNLQTTIAAVQVASGANAAVSNGNLDMAAQIAATNSNVVAVPVAPTTSNPVYNAFAGLASSLKISAGTEVEVRYQQQGVGTVIQPINSTTKAPYQLGDLSFDPGKIGTSDPALISAIFHGSGNPAWYIGAATDPIHLVNLQNMQTQAGFYPGLQWHADAYNPTWGINTLVQHLGSEVIPGGTYRAPNVGVVHCSVNGGCHP